ncbi:MAG: 50S ribosomal protein L11 methyltransferase [Sphingomicrobium sp.]
MSWRVTIAASRAQADQASDLSEPFPLHVEQPVLVADEPDPARPDDWLIHAYFERRPDDSDLDRLAELGLGTPEIEQLGEDDWVTMSQAGLQPIRAGRFFVHTPTHQPLTGAVNFEIDAGLAFGTGQHATTAGCLEALDQLEASGKSFANIADIGTGTGLLAFAALMLWPQAKVIATDIDPVSIEVTSDNATINGFALGQSPGDLLLAVADGMDHPLLIARAPFDLIIANILAAPLILLAPAFAEAAAPGATLLLAGLLDSQAEAVVAAYEAIGCTLTDGGSGEWRVLVFAAA